MPSQYKVLNLSEKLKKNRRKITMTSPCKSSRSAYKNNSVLSCMTLCKSVNASYKHYNTTVSMTQQGNLEIRRKLMLLGDKDFKKPAITIMPQNNDPR